jgi:uncharacterized protein (TIGR04255 family)
MFHNEKMNHPALKNPPIVEAIVDIRVAPPISLEQEQILLVKQKIGGQYQSIEALNVVDIALVGMQMEKPRTTVRGYLIKSIDQVNIAQFRVDGFAFSRLSPYTTWEELNRNAKQMWALYEDTFSPKQIVRIAVRYVNQMRFPVTIQEASQYLKISPSLPEDMRMKTKSFLTRTFIEDIDKQISASITQTLDENPNKIETIASLDIDTFSHRKFTPENQEIWTTFDELRVMKNKIFFESITTEAQNLFN